MKLTSENVEMIFLDCLFKEDEDHSDFIPAQGITSNVGFHPARLESHKEEIKSMLSELPETFMESSGGGWSFLNACQNANGEQWTGLHQRMEQLFQLGIAIKAAKFLMPREMWKVLPGGMPYVSVNI